MLYKMYTFLPKLPAKQGSRVILLRVVSPMQVTCNFPRDETVLACSVAEKEV